MPLTAAPIDPGELDCPVRETEARRALASGMEALGAVTRPRADATWVRQVVAERHPALGVTDALGGRSMGEPSNPARRLVEPDAPAGRLRWPDTPGGRYGDAATAVFRPPGPETVAAVDHFTALPHLTGYALTHQWLALIWAEDLDLDLPTVVTVRAPALEARVRAEVGAPGETLDLWAERAALVAAFGAEPVGPADRTAWLCRAVRTQHGSGTWLPDGTFRQPWEGSSFLVHSDAEHVTAVMVLLLGGLLCPA